MLSIKAILPNALWKKVFPSFLTLHFCSTPLKFFSLSFLFFCFPKLIENEIKIVFTARKKLLLLGVGEKKRKS